LGAAIGFTWSFEPKEGIDGVHASIGGWESSNTSTTGVAPVGAILSHVVNTITACVNDEMWCHSSTLHLVLQELDVVKLRVAAVPLTFKSAWVITARFTLMLSV